MKRITKAAAALVPLALAFTYDVSPDREVAVDLSGYDSRCGVTVASEPGKLTIRWPVEVGEVGELVLDLRR